MVCRSLHTFVSCVVCYTKLQYYTVHLLIIIIHLYTVRYKAVPSITYLRQGWRNSLIIMWKPSVPLQLPCLQLNQRKPVSVTVPSVVIHVYIKPARPHGQIVHQQQLSISDEVSVYLELYEAYCQLNRLTKAKELIEEAAKKFENTSQGMRYTWCVLCECLNILFRISITNDW